MAGNKVNAKARGKDDRGKGSSKSSIANNDDTEDTDFSLLRKPIQTSITGFAQARKIFDMATEELKGLLSDECDLLYECKVCRNLFRSLANFISHKRVYCQNKFNSTVHGHFIKSSSTLNELTKIKCVEEGYKESLQEAKLSKTDYDDRIPLTKDLTSIIEKIAKNKGTSTENTDNEAQVTFQKIPNSTIAVFQNLDTEMENDNMKTQVNELDNILSRNIAVLQNDGKFKVESSVPGDSTDKQTEAVIQISDDEDGGGDSLKCKQCDMQFSTQKTLKFHMKYKHVDTRVVYPCPDCLEIFSTSWSVYRHLFKVHRKSAAQIRRLRESIQAKAFKMNNPPAFYEKRKNNMKMASAPKITEEERLDQENQAWIDNMECDGEVPRCGGCGRTFERRAALAAHTHTCQPRSRALRRPEGKRIEIQIRKDYNKGPPSNLVLPATIDNNENKIVKEIKDKEKEKDKKEEEVKSKPGKKDQDVDEAPERSAVDEEGSRDSGMQLGDEETVSKDNSPAESPEKVEDPNPEPKPEPQAVKPLRLPFAQHAEKSNLMALRQRVLPDIDLERMRCKRCDTRCDHIQSLYDHVAKHYNWMRYACKLCNFKHYNFEKLPEHVKVVHKLKGDKDFYFSTVKAIDGPEATGLATPDETAEADEASPESRRPSRCSSDSSRLSDDSSSSSSRVEGSRKRKMTHKGPSKVIGKRRKSIKSKQEDEDWANKDDTLVKTFEENSSDIDDTYDRIAKRCIEEFSTVASRRPVRRKAKPKNEDFEYDLSNLLKMEAQGYRESQNVNTTNPKSIQNKKKPPPEMLSNYEMLNKESCGALESLSRKAVENAKAHMKTPATLYIQRERIPSSIFVRPMLPKGLNRGDKLSPKKDNIDEKKENTVLNKETPKDVSPANIDSQESSSKTEENDASMVPKEGVSTDLTKSDASKVLLSDTVVTSGPAVEQKKCPIDSNTAIAKVKPKTITNFPVLPLKFRRESIEAIKNSPVLNKSISEFTKSGMKTKILVIKPFRNKDGMRPAVNTPLKFQRIKIKDPIKSTLSDDKSSERVVVVNVPKVDCVSVVPENPVTQEPSDTMAVNKRTERTLSAPDALLVENVSVPDTPNNDHSNLQQNGEISINPVSEIEATDKAISKLDSNEEITYVDTTSDLTKVDMPSEPMDE